MTLNIEHSSRQGSRGAQSKSTSVLRRTGHRQGQTLRRHIHRLQDQIQREIGRLETLCLQYKQTQAEGSTSWMELAPHEDQDGGANKACSIDARAASGAKT